MRKIEEKKIGPTHRGFEIDVWNGAKSGCPLVVIISSIRTPLNVHQRVQALAPAFGQLLPKGSYSTALKGRNRRIFLLQQF